MKEVVYFVRNVASGLIKIGTTGDMHIRMTGLSEGGKPVRLEAQAPGNRTAEGTLHAIFFEDHVAGEWFRSSPRLEAMIVAVREGWCLPDALPRQVSPLKRAACLKAHETRRRIRAEAA